MAPGRRMTILRDDWGLSESRGCYYRSISGVGEVFGADWGYEASDDWPYWWDYLSLDY